MKTIARAVTALALLAFATPALPCGDKHPKTTTASAGEEKAPVAKSSAEDRDEKAAAQAKSKQASKPATAAN